MIQSRLDAIQAVVGNWILPKAKKLLKKELKMLNIQTKVSKIEGLDTSTNKKY